MTAYDSTTERSTAEFFTAINLSLAADAATFTLSPGSIAERIDAGAASFALTGQDAGYTLSNEPFAFSLTVYDSLVSIDGMLAPASYSVFGQSAFAINAGIGYISAGQSTAEMSTAEFAYLQTNSIAAEAGSFALNGQRIAEIIFADPASFVLSGQSAQMAIAVDAAAFVVSGQDALLLESLLPASYVLTPIDTFQIQTIPAEPGSFVLTGVDAFQIRRIGAEPAVFTVLGWSVRDITGPTGDHIYLIELQAHDGSSVQTFYLSTTGFMSMPFDVPANQYYDPRVIDPGNFERSLFDGTSLRGRGRSSSGDIRVASGDPGNGETLDDWFFYGFSQREIRIKSQPRLSRSLADMSTLFIGKTDRVSSTQPLDTIDVRISDRLKDLELPLLTEVYAGTTTASGATAEGNSDLKGQIKQQCWGTCYSVPLQQANAYDLIYLASNSVVQSITVYDGGLALTLDGDSANISALQGAVVAAGHYRTCLAAGLVKVGATPERQLSADVVEGATSADRTAGQIAYRMLIDFGISPSAISSGHIDELDLLNASECGYFVDDNRTCLTAAQDVLDSINAWMVPNVDGTLIFGRLDEPGTTIQSTKNIESVSLGDSLDRTVDDLPVWRVTLEYAPVFLVQSESETFDTVTDERRGFLAKAFRTVTAEDTSVKTKHLAAQEITIRTYLVSEADAQDECDRQLALLSVERERVNLTLPLSDAWGSNPGDSMLLQHPRLGWDSGKAFRVLRRVDQYSNDTLQFSLWG